MGTTESIFYDEENEKEEEDPPASRGKVQRPTTTSASTRRRNLQRPPEKPLFKLDISILGLPKTGKQTLMHRLRGKDPFAAVQEKQTKAVVPYQSPRPVEDLIQLQVQIHPSHEKCDLVVLLIDPRHDRDRIEQSISEATEFLLTQNNKPFCLCILVNFWDKMYKKKQGKSQLLVSESDVQQMTLLAIQAQSDDFEPSRLHLQCTSTSLFNCYGLGVLHFFIYQSYLLHKQWQLQNTLYMVQQSLKQSRESGPQVVPYDEYLRQLRNLPPVSSPPKEPPPPLQDSTPAPRRAVVVPVETNKSVTGLQNAEASRKALEAFLADDDDDDNDEKDSRTKQQTYGSDDDSEVFYDESGQRQSTGQEHNNHVRVPTEIPVPSESAQLSEQKSRDNETPEKTRNQYSIDRPIQKISTGDENDDRSSHALEAITETGNARVERRNDSKNLPASEEASEEGGSSPSIQKTSKPGETDDFIATNPSEAPKRIHSDPTEFRKEVGNYSIHISGNGSIQNERVLCTEDTHVAEDQQRPTEIHTEIPANDDNYESDASVDEGDSGVIMSPSPDDSSKHKATDLPKIAPTPVAEEGDDKNEFFVEEEVGEGDLSKPSNTDASTNPINTPNKHSSISAEKPLQHAPVTASSLPVSDKTDPNQSYSATMSSAVLAAIAAAQQQAEMMLQQQLLEEKEKILDKKSKKEKKDKKKKEKKEKKKKTRKEGDNDDSN